MPKKTLKKHTLYFFEEDIKKLKMIGMEKNIKVSSIIRRLIEEFIDGEEAR